MRHFKKICDLLDVEPLRKQLDDNADLWNQHPGRMAGDESPFAGTSDLWVRYNDISRARPNFEGFNDEHVPVWYPAWHRLPALRPLVFDLMALVQGEMLGGVLITRVPDGAKIAPHVDSGWHVDYYDKFYISLESAPGALFHVKHDGQEESLNPAPGDCWLFDNRKLHWVTNTSGKARVTLIVCIRTDMFGRAPCHLPMLPPPQAS